MTAPASVAYIVESWLHAVAGGICGPAWSSVIYAAREIVEVEFGHYDGCALAPADIAAAWLRLVDEGEHHMDVDMAQDVLDEAYKLAVVRGRAPFNPAAAVFVP